MYNTDLMRWLSPDPYHQNYSPYLAMNNNPVSFIDGDGGSATTPGDPSNQITYFVDGIQVSTDNGLAALNNAGYTTTASSFIGSMFSNYISWTFDSKPQIEPGEFLFSFPAYEGGEIDVYSPSHIGYETSINSTSDVSGFLPNQNGRADNSISAGGAGGEVTYNNLLLKQGEINTWRDWGSSHNPFKRLPYDIADGLWIFSQRMFLLDAILHHGSTEHIGGGTVSASDRIDKPANSLSTLVNLGGAGYLEQQEQFFAKQFFTSKTFGVESETFGNKIFSETGTSGTLNQKGSMLKIGWSSTASNGGGMYMRIGLGTSSANANQALIHIAIPFTFIENEFSNAYLKIAQVFRSLK